MIDSNSVANAYSVPIGNLSGMAAQFGQQAIAAQQLAEKERQRQEYQSANLLQSTVDPLLKGTGTPYDTYANNKIQDIIGGFNTLLTKNPHLSYRQQQEYLMGQVGSLKPQMDNAKLAQQQVDAMVSQLGKDHPNIDNVRLQNAAMNQVFGQAAQSGIVDPTAAREFFNGLSDDNKIVDYLNRGETQNLARKAISDYPLQAIDLPYRSAEGFKGKMSVQAPFYYDVNPSTGERRLATETIGGQTALPARNYEVLSGNEPLRHAFILKSRELAKSNPEFAKLPEDDQRRIAAASVVNEIGQAKLPPNEISYERQHMLDAEQAHRDANANAAASRDIAYQNLQLRKDAAALRNKTNVAKNMFKVINEDEEMLKSAPKEVIDIPTGAGGSVKKKLYNLTGFTKTGFLNATDGTGDKLKIYYDPISKRAGVARFQAKKDLVNNVTKYVPAEKDPWEIIPKSKIGEYLSPFTPQLNQRPTDVGDEYDQYLQDINQ